MAEQQGLAEQEKYNKEYFFESARVLKKRFNQYQADWSAIPSLNMDSLPQNIADEGYNALGGFLTFLDRDLMATSGIDTWKTPIPVKDYPDVPHNWERQKKLNDAKQARKENYSQLGGIVDKLYEVHPNLVTELLLNYGFLVDHQVNIVNKKVNHMHDARHFLEDFNFTDQKENQYSQWYEAAMKTQDAKKIIQLFTEDPALITLEALVEDITPYIPENVKAELERQGIMDKLDAVFKRSALVALYGKREDKATAEDVETET